MERTRQAKKGERGQPWANPSFSMRYAHSPVGSWYQILLPSLGYRRSKSQTRWGKCLRRALRAAFLETLLNMLMKSICRIARGGCVGSSQCCM